MLQAEFIDFAKELQNPHVAAWKAKGGRVVGFYCTDMPEQVIHAAGMLPFRMRGTGNKDYTLSDAILSRFNCTFVRSALNLAMGGRYAFLDGLVVGNTCDHIRRMYDVFGRKLAFEPRFFLSFPHVFTDEGRAWVKDEIERFVQQLSKAYGVSITPEALRDALAVYRENARLLEKIQALRQQDEPRISGTDFIRIAVANGSVRKDFANEQIRKLLPAIEAQQAFRKVRARLMVAGSFVDNPDFIEVLEHAGALVVADSLCIGERSFWDPGAREGGNAPPPADPLDELVRLCYERSLCPRIMGGHAGRLQFVQDQIRDARVDGVVLERIEFCDLHGCSNMMLQHVLEDEGVPVLSLDREYSLGDTGRFKTRVEAFLEKIGG
ncbi:MAG: 2-hydroxyacyl-CoA dehydratase [Candidatus Lokiarchaeota archaeon]|nr:2-hydroxyacyl-CoA dehydratase [Candidatus Lokiarchaeota archaeon]